MNAKKEKKKEKKEKKRKKKKDEINYNNTEKHITKIKKRNKDRSC